MIYKLKMFKRYIVNYFNDKGQINLAKSKFPHLTINEVNNFMKKIIEVENYQEKDFVLKENLPGLFTIECKKI